MLLNVFNENGQKVCATLQPISYFGNFGVVICIIKLCCTTVNI